MRGIRTAAAFVFGVLLPIGCGGKQGQAGQADEDRAAPTLDALAAAPCDLGPATAITDSTVARLLTGATRLDGEVYDCQRLVLSTGAAGEFGPLVGLYPVDATLRLGLGRTDFTNALPAAAVYSWGAAGGSYADAYPELAPAAGAACLWLRNAAGTVDGWRAALVAGAGCGDSPGPPHDSTFALRVFERVYPGTASVDYPRTARWQWDLDARRQIIGVKCGDAWCEVTGKGGGEPRTQPLEGGNAVAREKVPGWSDAQHLAVYDSAAGRARPGPWGSVVAYHGIAGEAPAWVEGLLAARMTVYGAAGAFSDRFYLQPEGASGHDDLILRFPGMQDEAWLQQGPMRRRKASRIQFAPTADHQVVGTVRWRWNDHGETIWVYCSSATCAVEP
ncbi:MAG: hypothetical protein EXR95_09910 [Gemmatimonadetes bacterium]|nr:hypothetical protein [Gemmatimonadota bacterium]